MFCKRQTITSKQRIAGEGVLLQHRMLVRMTNGFPATALAAHCSPVFLLHL
jgi:hypothetical protein